jgi:hypothetical protein
LGQGFIFGSRVIESPLVNCWCWNCRAMNGQGESNVGRLTLGGTYFETLVAVLNRQCIRDIWVIYYIGRVNWYITVFTYSCVDHV